MLETIKELISSFAVDAIKAVFHFGKRKFEPSPSRLEYESLRRMAAEALTMNACYYCNPVDIAQHDNKLPESYVKGSEELRTLGSKFIGFAVTLPNNIRDLPISKEELDKVGHYFIGLSNCFNTPYQCPGNYESVRTAQMYEREVRNLLNID